MIKHTQTRVARIREEHYGDTQMSRLSLQEDLKHMQRNTPFTSWYNDRGSSRLRQVCVPSKVESIRRKYKSAHILNTGQIIIGVAYPSDELLITFVLWSMYSKEWGVEFPQDRLL